jgi:hypothetical protein
MGPALELEELALLLLSLLGLVLLEGLGLLGLVLLEGLGLELLTQLGQTLKVSVHKHFSQSLKFPVFV